MTPWTSGRVRARHARRLVGLLLALASAPAVAVDVAATFAPATIGPGSTAELDITLTNSGATAVTDLAVTGTLPAAVTLATPAAGEQSCGGELAATDGSGTFTLSGGRLATGERCSVRVLVTATTPGTHSLVTGDVTSSAGNDGPVSAELTVDTARPGFAKGLSPANVQVGERARLTYTIDNTASAADQYQLQFSETLPPGLRVAAPTNARTSCAAGTVDAVAGTRAVGFASGSVSAGASCTVELDVTAVAVGGHIVRDSGMSALPVPPGGPLRESGHSVAALTAVSDVVHLTKRFEPNPVIPGSETSLVYALQNTSRTETATGLAFNDDLDATLSGLAATGGGMAGVCGAGSNVAGDAVVSFSGGALAPGERCEFSVPLAVPAAAASGAYVSVTGALSGTIGGAPLSATPFQAVLDVAPRPSLEKEYFPELVGGGQVLTLTHTLRNRSTTASATGVAFQQAVPNGFTVNQLPANGFCGAGSQLLQTQIGGEAYLVLLGANLPARGSCSFMVDFQVPEGIASGSGSTPTVDFVATVDGKEVPGVVEDPGYRTVASPRLDLAVEEAVVGAGETATLRVHLSNDNGGAIDADVYDDFSGIAFTADLDAALSGLSMAGPGVTDVCGSGSQASGTSTVSFAGGSLAAASSCEFTLPLAIPADASPGLYTLASSDVTAVARGVTVTGPGNDATLNAAALDAALSFGDAPVAPGGTATLTYTLANPSTTHAATAIQFTHDLGATLSGLSASVLSPAGVCGAGSQVTGTDTLIFSGGQLPPGGSCSFSVDVTIPGGAASGTYGSVTRGNVATYDGQVRAFPAASGDLTVQDPNAPRDLTPSNLNEPDPDGDGVATSDEEAAGDANGDGIADALQPTVASLISPVSGRVVAVEVGQACGQIASFEIVDAASLGLDDAGYAYADGVAVVELDCAAAEVVLSVPGATVSEFPVVRGLGPEAGTSAPEYWFEWPGAVLDADAPAVTVNVQDDGLGDLADAAGTVRVRIGLAEDVNGDGDAVPTADEALVGDGNGDGIADADQAAVTSLISPLTGRPVTVEVPVACGPTAIVNVEDAATLGTDAGYSYPDGLVTVGLDCAGAEVTVTWPGALFAGFHAVRGFDPTGWFDWPGASLDPAGERVSVTIADGDSGDIDADPGSVRARIGLAADEDGDGDGVPTDVEAGGGDSNGDGIPDAEQADVASTISPVTGNRVVLEVGGQCARIDAFSVVRAGDVAPADGERLYPRGLARFELPCASALVTLTYVGEQIGARETVRKYGPLAPDFADDSVWYPLRGAVIDRAGGWIRFSLTDGERGDATGVDGRIVDPVGLAVPSSGPVSIPVGGGVWGVLLALGLWLVGLQGHRRRR